MNHMDDDTRLLESLREASRSEPLPVALGERILDQVEYRARILQGTARVPQRPRLLAVAAALLVVAAGVGLTIRPFRVAPPIAPEPAAAPSFGAQAPLPSASAAPATVCLGRAAAQGGQPLIDDFEDGDDAVLSQEGRVGFWRWAREIDEPGSAPALMPVLRPLATRSNQLALHVKGGQLLDWGATIEFTFRPACYDASKYRGVAFVARGPGRIYFSPREVSVVPPSEGGSCQADCYNQHVKKVDLEAEWRRYEVTWAEVRQRGVGKPPLDPSRINSLAFLIRPEDTPYDVWLDDVRFLTF